MAYIIGIDYQYISFYNILVPEWNLRIGHNRCQKSYIFLERLDI